MADARLRDARDMHGVSQLANAVQVRAWQDEFLARHDRERVADGRTVGAYVSHGRWVADCAECNGGIAVFPGESDGTCMDCGHEFEVEFPDDLDDAVEALLNRPEARTRNWRPDRESLADLLEENLLRGASRLLAPTPAQAANRRDR